MKTISTKFALTLLLHSFFFSAIIFGNPTNTDQKTVKIREQLMKLGVGEQSKIEVKLKDGSKLKGALREVKENDFVVMDEITNNEVTVSYPQVQKAKVQNLNGVTKTLIIAGIMLLAVIVIAATAGKP